MKKKIAVEYVKHFFRGPLENLSVPQKISFVDRSHAERFITGVQVRMDENSFPFQVSSFKIVTA